MVRDLMEQKGYSVEDMIDSGFSSVEQMTKGTASEAIDFLFKAENKVKPNGDPADELPPIESYDDLPNY
ncbi:MAG: hypothetical protein QOE46_1189 [Acidobacteriota bacterium]|nr:hypothetical protein [Acidobacteriota bacterium]